MVTMGTKQFFCLFGQYLCKSWVYLHETLKSDVLEVHYEINQLKYDRFTWINMLLNVDM